MNLSPQPRIGTRRLRVQDTAFGDTGRIDSWAILPVIALVPRARSLVEQAADAVELVGRVGAG